MTAKVSITLNDLLLMKAEARGFSFLPRQPVSSLLSGRHGSRLRGRGLTFEELRTYHPGDDIRTIDWKATARLRSTQVRVYNEERERPVFLLVDQRLPMFFGSRRAMKSVVAAELSALAAWRSLDVGDRVGGIVFNESEIAKVRPHRSRTRVLELLNEITRFNQQLASEDPPQGDLKLNDALRAALHIITHDYLVVVISDFDGADEETKRLSTLLAARNDVLIVAVYDPLGSNLVGSPGMIASDRGETWEIPTDEAFHSKFKQSFAKRLATWREIFHNIKIPVIPIATDISPADQIRSQFGNH